MNLSRLWLLVLLMYVADLSAAPVINSVVNAASNIVPGLPNAPIAQGSIFVLYGTGLGPESIAYSPAPFQTDNVSGTSVSVTVGTTTVAALMLYTSAGQVAALLPSNTPTGPSQFKLTYNGQISNTLNHLVVANNPGLFTIDSSGDGPAVVDYSDYSLVSAVKSANCGGPNTACGAANPGDVLILWATGLGPVNGDDASGAGLGQNMPDLPLKVWLGGVQAPVMYQGRSGCCIGEDQVVFMVPKNVPTGCAVPLVVQIGNEVSNTTALAVANGTRTCTASNPTLANAEQDVLAGPARYGDIKLKHTSDGGGKFEDDVRDQFLKITDSPGNQPFFISWVDEQPLGTCLVYNNLNEDSTNGIASIDPLDPGSNLKIMGPKGSVTGVANQNVKISADGTFLVPGVFTITGSGGADVGAFSANVTIPALPKLVSPANGAAVTRASGMTVTWTGGGGDILIEIFGPTDNTYTNGAVAYCRAAGAAGKFTIPSYVLLALPATTSNDTAGFVFSSVSMAPFSATGIEIGIVETYLNADGFGYGWGSGNFTLK